MQPKEQHNRILAVPGGNLFHDTSRLILHIHAPLLGLLPRS
jgi:hypothetical protein